MKKIVKMIVWAALAAFCLTSCYKEEGGIKPYYQVESEYSIDFVNGGIRPIILLYEDNFLNKDFTSEAEALSKITAFYENNKGIGITPSAREYLKIFIVRYIPQEESETSVRMVPDPDYKSPKTYVWDKNGSREE